MSSRLPQLTAFLTFFLACLPHLRAAENSAAAQPSTSFLTEVTAHFAAWDLNRDGKLSMDEVERAVGDPKICGPTAAAAVALRRKLRMDSDIGAWTMEKVQEDKPVPAGSPKPMRRQLEALYDAALKYINTTPHELFTAEEPKLNNLGQGHLGDCFLLVGIGVLAENDPARLKQMLDAKPDGRLSVHLGTGRTLEIAAPSDGEIALGSRTRGTGTWGVALEKAVGSVYLERQKTPRHVTPLDIVGVGGSPHTPVELITGHVVRKFGCEAFRKTDLSETQREALLAELRQKLTDAFQQHRLVVGGNGPIGHQAIVPHIYYNHSYGVLAYDSASDEVTFWNPFGNQVTPKGPPGLANGYVTDHGRFRVPLKEAVQWFGAFSIETDEALPARKAL